MAIELSVNGKSVSVAVEASVPLLDVLRNHLDLKGSRFLGTEAMPDAPNLVCLTLAVTLASGADDVATLRRQAGAAYQAKDWKGFLDKATAAAALRPDHPGLLYNVA